MYFLSKPKTALSDNSLRQPIHSRLLLTAILLIAMLSSCALTPTQSLPAHTYLLLTPQLSTQAAPPQTRLTLLVSTPRAAAGYNTQQMAYTRKLYELSYFSHNEWIDIPGHMLEPILVSALEASRGFQSVVPSYVRIPADLRLDTEIILLVQDFSTQPSQARIALHARLIELASGQEIAGQTFEAQEPMLEENPYSGVIALNQALEHILRELVSFCVQGSSKVRSLNSSAID